VSRLVRLPGWVPSRAAHTLRRAQLVTSEDLCGSSEVDWYFPIDPYAWRWELPQTTNLGRKCSRTFAWALERVGLAPKGTSEVSGFLEKGQDGLCEGGRTGIFTPMYLVVARKPGAANGAA
jgi:sterol 24-C-methyltransferase